MVDPRGPHRRARNPRAQRDVQRREPARVHLQRNHDNTLTVPAPGRRPGPRLNFNAATPAQRPIQQAHELIISRLLAETKNPGALLTADPYSRSWPLFTNRAAQANVNLRLLPCKTGGTPKGGRTTVEKLPALITTLVRKHLADPGVMRRADQLPTQRKSDWRLNLYNNLITNREATSDLEKTNPSAARYFTENVLPNMEREESFRPAGIIAAVREEAKIPSPYGKWFTRLRGSWESVPGHPVRATELATICRLLQEANVPDPGQDKIRVLASMRHAHYQMERNPAEWQAWTRTVNRYLELEEPFQRTHRNTLLHIADAIQHVAGRWGPGTWEEMIRRADQTLQHRAGQKMTPLVTWKNAITRTEHRGHVFTALSSNHELENWGDSLANCLANYADRCRNGTDRIFIGVGPGGETAAVQLHNDGAGWAPVQIEGPGHALPSREMEMAAGHLARAYQEKDAPTENGE